MSVTVILTLPINPEKKEAFFQLLSDLAPGTQQFGGCLGYDTYSDQNDPGKVVFVEHWESMEAYQAYNAWRTETGVMEQLDAYFTGAPTLQFCDRQDGWRAATGDNVS